MSNLDENNPISGLMQVLSDTATEAGPLIVEDMRDAIGEPYPPASEPGTPPHRRSGNLQLSIVVDNEIRQGEVAIIVSSDVPYSYYLEHGTDRMAPRPVWDFIERRWSGRILDLLSDNISSSL